VSSGDSKVDGGENLTEQIARYRDDDTLTRLDQDYRDRERFDRAFRDFGERATTVSAHRRRSAQHEGERPRDKDELDEVIVTRQDEDTCVEVHDSFLRNRRRFRLLELDADSNFDFDAFISYYFVFNR
jgi:hypothetical protein